MGGELRNGAEFLVRASAVEKKTYLNQTPADFIPDMKELEGLLAASIVARKSLHLHQDVADQIQDDGGVQAF